ncbi:hypothetical protein C7M84_012723 [Penaeus vannamei]|uniref:C-type lectin domain-containing protein n=1 Tax=Penaeus vannamei TaxID=6689 RepID=A0A3R7SP47_PENVA|nr:hypothetical protein C7M84_012723 [Penaeus vannamei]
MLCRISRRFGGNRTFETTAGRPESTVDLATARVKGHGRFVLGQNVNPSSDWDVTQTFHGEMVDFRYYNTTVPLEDLVKYTTCRAGGADPEPLYGFEKDLTALDLRGSVEVVEAELEEICRPVFSYLVMFTQKLTFDGALGRCRSFVGDLAVPHDLQENDRIYDDFVRFNDQCTQGWAALFWLGLEGNVSAASWRNIAEDEPLAWGKWLESWELPTKQYPCATFGGVGIPSMWYNADCATLTCALCNFTAQPRLRVRGLCPESKFDRNFILHGYENGRPVVEGNFFSRIFWDNSTWVMADRRDPGVEARMVEKRPKGYPLGLNAWDFKGDDCAVPRVRDFPLRLHPPDACDREAFTCSDGSCVPLARRCDPDQPTAPTTATSSTAASSWFLRGTRPTSRLRPSARIPCRSSSPSSSPPSGTSTSWGSRWSSTCGRASPGGTRGSPSRT